MDWEDTTVAWEPIPTSDIPDELLEALERYSVDATLTKARLRWRPATSKASSFVTKDRLLNLRGRSTLDIAHALASYATYLYTEEDCESRFEAQIKRELEDPPEEGSRSQWRSVTFHLANTAELDEQYASPPSGFSFAAPAETRESPSPPLPRYEDYAEFVSLSRSDPNAFAMLVMQHSHDRSINIMERMLMSSLTRIDAVLSNQISNSTHLNRALETLTKGAGAIAGIGVNLFERGLENRAQVLEIERNADSGKERAEVMREAVKQGSLLAQAVMMSQASKRAGPRSQAPTPSRPPPAPEPAVSSQDALLVERAQQVLELLEHEDKAKLRRVAPTVAAFFERMGRGPLSAQAIRALVFEAQRVVDHDELSKLSAHISDALADVFGALMMQVFSEAN